VRARKILPFDSSATIARRASTAAPLPFPTRWERKVAMTVLELTATPPGNRSTRQGNVADRHGRGVPGSTAAITDVNSHSGSQRGAAAD
jgi:hypothetical protein